jgi:hypothetical protein
MSFDPKNGYTREAWIEFPDVEEASATLSGITGLAPNRSQTITGKVLSTIGVNVAQQGTNAVSNVTTITNSWAGIPARNLALNNFTAGSVGTTGNKFS